MDPPNLATLLHLHDDARYADLPEYLRRIAADIRTELSAIPAEVVLPKTINRAETPQKIFEVIYAMGQPELTKVASQAVGFVKLCRAYGYDTSIYPGVECVYDVS